jgi:hypothetical protein
MNFVGCAVYLVRKILMFRRNLPPHIFGIEETLTLKMLCLAVSCFSKMEVTSDLCSFILSIIICFVQILFFSILCPVQLMAMWFEYRTMNVCYLKHISVQIYVFSKM